jgi:hypothetical protein
MSTSASAALTTFTANLIERYGGVVEERDGKVLSLLPADLAGLLELPEEAVIGGEEAPLIYGSPIVDRIIRIATDDVPVVYARAEVQYLKQAGFDTVLAKELQLAGVRSTIASRAETVANYLILVCHYVARSDERKEGLVQVAINERTCAHVLGMETLWRDFQVEPYPQGHIPPQFDSSPDKGLHQALQVAREVSATELQAFIEGMRRRLHRDVRSTREYYAALRHEMEAALARPNLSENLREKRLLKIESLPEELNAKIRDLEHKYSVTVEVTGRAVLRLLVPVVQLMMRLSYKKLKGTLSMIWNPITQRFDPCVCTQCGKAVRQLWPKEGKTGLKLVCKPCWDGTR